MTDQDFTDVLYRATLAETKIYLVLKLLKNLREGKIQLRTESLAKEIERILNV